MDENAAAINPSPLWSWHGIERYNVSGDHLIVIGARFRVMWAESSYTGCIFNRGVWQIEVGHLMMCWFWEIDE